MRGMREHHNVVVRFLGRVLHAVLGVVAFVVGLGALIWLVDTLAGTQMIPTLQTLWDEVTSGGFKKAATKTIGMVFGALFAGWLLMEMLFPSSPPSYRGKVYVDRNGDGRIDHRDGPQ